MTDDARDVDPTDPGPHLSPETAPGVHGERHPWRLAALFVAPFALLALVWALSNPPAAAPDENDHLTKALGNSVLDFGAKGPAYEGDDLLLARNASTLRIFSVPSRLTQPAYTCFAFKPNESAACQPDSFPEDTGNIDVASPVGAYPPFFYFPIGWAAHLASTPYEAFVAGRLVVIAMSSLLLMLGVAHLMRWLGRRSVVGVVAAVTPIGVYTMGTITTSSVELMAAIAAASVVTVAILRPESVRAPSTHWTLAVAGSALVLSRQLGAICLAALILVLMVHLGWPRVKELFASRQRSFYGAVIVLMVATVTITWYEVTFDRPAETGPVFSADAFSAFLNKAYPLFQSGVGRFGWLDTPLPGPVIGLWMGMWVVVVGTAALIGRRREMATLLLWVFGTWFMAYALYASGFYPIAADVQGRHILPTAAFALVLGGAVLAERLGSIGTTVLTRLFVGIGVLAGLIQFFSLYWNARRYAVGMEGRIWFLPTSEWSPVGGWAPWLVLALIGGILLTAVVVSFRPRSTAAPAHSASTTD
ncbi:MAG: DUF2142 domain-containing protein [Aeromicrobium sp.]